MTERRCDLFENPYEDACIGPFAEDAPVTVCGKHLIRSRDEWMTRATSAEREVAALKDAVARAEDAHEHDIWASCGCLAGGGHAPDSMECPFPGEAR